MSGVCCKRQYRHIVRHVVTDVQRSDPAMEGNSVTLISQPNIPNHHEASPKSLELSPQYSIEMIAPFANVYNLRKVAEASAKACDTCYKPTTSVLITPDKKVRIKVASISPNYKC